MTIVKWSPRTRGSLLPAHFGGFSRGIERIFDDFFSNATDTLPGVKGMLTGDTGAHGPFVPRVDLKETEDAYEVRFEVPGFAKEDLDVQIEENVVRVSGNHREEHSTGDAGGEDVGTEGAEPRYHTREVYTASFSRDVALPGEVEAGGHTAGLKDGILTISLRKAAPVEQKPVKVEIG